MPTDYSFRLSMYLSLALACACLGYAEADLLPSGAVIAGLCVLLLAVAFRYEGRFELGLAAANRLGVVLFVAAGVWLVTQFADRTSLLYTVPWPAGGLPYFGTLLLAAMPAKLLRPKHTGDWWALQAMGLAAVTLACALAEDEVFGGLLTLYAVAAVAGLGLFYVKREAGQVPPAPRDPLLVGGVEWLIGRRLSVASPAPPAVVASAPTRVRAAWRPAVGWLLVAAAVALPLFFLTPRSNAPRWTMGATLETGYDSPQMVDLTRTGELRLNTETAFEVTVTDATGRPYDGLSAGQRWRGIAYGLYEAGRWRGMAHGRLMDLTSLASPDQTPGAAPAPPPLRPDMLVVTYTPRTKTSEPPLADPVRWEAGAGSPAWIAARGGRPANGLAWIHKLDASFSTPFPLPGGREGYVQYVYPPTNGDPDLGTGFDPAQADPSRQVLGALGGSGLLFADPIRGAYPPAGPLLAMPAGLKELPVRTRQLLDDLVSRGKLAAQVTGSARFRRDGRPEPADWEAVAVAFRDHLGTQDYEWTLKLRRQDRQSDPVEDFLFRTKAGNCERFAAALVLMCRAVGVPARYVLGFKGHELVGDGKYVVRQDHTHAWAEVLIPRRAPTPAGFRWHWVSLDPSPDGGHEDEPADGLLGSAARGGRSFFQQFIVNYNAERRRQAADELTEAVTAAPFLRGLGAAVGIVAGGLLAWRLIRRFRRPPSEMTTTIGWYDRMLRTLERAGHPVATGQTPVEFAARLHDRLPAGVTDIPAELTMLYYRDRFGRVSPTTDELTRIENDLARLESALPQR